MSQESSRQIVSSSNQATGTPSNLRPSVPLPLPVPVPPSYHPAAASSSQTTLRVPAALQSFNSTNQPVAPPADNIYHRPVSVGYQQPPPHAAIRRHPSQPGQSAYYYRPGPTASSSIRSVSAPLRTASISGSSTSSSSGSSSVLTSNSSSSSSSTSTSAATSTSSPSALPLRRMDTLISTYPSQRTQFGASTPDLATHPFLTSTSAPTSYLGTTTSSDEPLLNIDPKYVQQIHLEDPLGSAANISSPVMWASSPSTSSVVSQQSAAANIPMSPSGYTTSSTHQQYPSHLHYLSSGIPSTHGPSSPIVSNQGFTSTSMGLPSTSLHSTTSHSSSGNLASSRSEEDYDYYRRQEEHAQSQSHQHPSQHSSQHSSQQHPSQQHLQGQFDRADSQQYQQFNPQVYYQSQGQPASIKQDEFGGLLGTRIQAPPSPPLGAAPLQNTTNEYTFNDSKHMYNNHGGEMLDTRLLQQQQQQQQQHQHQAQPHMTHFDGHTGQMTMAMPMHLATGTQAQMAAATYYPEYPSAPGERERRGHSRTQSAYAQTSGSQPGEKKYQCPECGKYFRRDLPRHLRTHQEIARFVCPFPRPHCPHKRGQFNRPYDFKKHLLHSHFVFDDQKMVRSFRDLKSKLGYEGTCACGVRYRAGDWLDQHVFGSENRCPYLSHNH
ncbi:hypothetical protein AWJ20_5287 [Sugiyamaella lignohabitans]|uniref:C2H2-type domain-containing protein n=1 Tax=Sugiyamaella lignohabitans TaxID=796027 RepID=A0A167EPT8_9ASCO|nr:uncharacterized protein AWJ20_5287 [Sugiyamaella lignohabitans]ANB14322.1 hypothetical protein AWJ20_5287 [Sugiyamaella lignohabitans]